MVQKKKPARSRAKKTDTPKKTLVSRTKTIWQNATRRPVGRIKGLLSRRPHRSFRLTRRSDYKRSLKMPGYWSFTNYVRATLWKNWRLFGGLALVYVAATIVISGLGAQETYNNLSQTIRDSGEELFQGNLGQVAQAGIVLISAVTTGLSPNLTEAQSILGGLAFFFAWLATIWLLRNTLAGHKPRLRDGLYNSGSPVLASVLVGFIIVLQLLPGAIAIIIYSAAQTSGLMEAGVSAMLVWMSVILLGMVSLYWITSSFIALVIVTLPGMYPMHAIRSAGDMVVGRRLRVLFRLAWLLFIVVLAWALIVIPIILFDEWLKRMVPAINWLPLVPLVIMSLGAVTLIYVTSYVYLFYRRIVDDDDAPA